MNTRKTIIIVSSLILTHLVLLIFLRFTAWPEMLLWPYLSLKGWLPYENIILPYTPGLFIFMDWAGRILGVSVISLKLLSWTLFIITDLVVFFVAKKIFKDNSIAILSLLFFVIWQPFFEGNGLWYDHVLAPLAILTFYFLLRGKYELAGIFFGLALSIKQTTFFLVPPLLLTFLVSSRLSIKNIFRFIAGFIIPLIFCFIYLYLNNLLPEFYKWAIQYGIFYLPKASGQILLPTLKQFLAVMVPYGGMLVMILLFFLKKTDQENKTVLFSLFAWTTFGALGIYPRWEYFHFQPSLPFLALISGYVLNQIRQRPLNRLLLLLLIFLIAGTFRFQARFYGLNWQKPDRFLNQEVIQLAGWIKENTSKREKIYLLNVWDHVYVLSGTLPATDPWVPPLPWYFRYPGIEEKVVLDLQFVRPSLVIQEPYAEKGLGSYKRLLIDEFVQKNYKQTKIVVGKYLIFEPKEK